MSQAKRDNDGGTGGEIVQPEQTEHYPPAEENVIALGLAGQRATPDGMYLELRIILRPIWDTRTQVPEDCPRDVYLQERDPRQPAARSLFLYHTMTDKATVQRICLWAEMLHIPIVQDPPGNLEPGFQWPNHSQVNAPMKGPKKIKSALDDF